MTHEILPEAREEFENAIEYLDAQASGLGQEFRAEVVRTLERILESPESGSRFDLDLSYRSVSRFRYVVVYAIRHEHVVIVAVMHEARRPRYWLSRLEP